MLSLVQHLHSLQDWIYKRLEIRSAFVVQNISSSVLSLMTGQIWRNLDLYQAQQLVLSQLQRDHNQNYFVVTGDILKSKIGRLVIQLVDDNAVVVSGDQN